MTMQSTFDEARDQILHATDWIHRSATDAKERLERSAEAGTKLAEAVYRYVQDPEGVGLDELTDARLAFLTDQASGFARPLDASSR